MCEPVSLGTALTIASGAASYFGGQASAKAQEQANNNSLALTYQQTAEQQKQTNDKAALDQSERIKQGMVERGHIAAIAGESGALGFSSDRLLNDSFMQEGTDISSMEKNRQNDIAQTVWKEKSAQSETQSKNATAASTTPTLIGTGLQIGSGIYGIKSSAKKAAVV